MSRIPKICAAVAAVVLIGTSAQACDCYRSAIRERVVLREVAPVERIVERVIERPAIVRERVVEKSRQRIIHVQPLRSNYRSVERIRSY